MILVYFIVVLLAAGILAWLAARWSVAAARWICLAAAGFDFVLGIWLWSSRLVRFDLFAGSDWIEEVDWTWVPQLGIHFHLAMDGLSLLMVMLTLFLGVLSVLASWTEITESVGFFHFNLMWILAGITAVFLASDLFLFYFAWEVMLIPMYFLIALWGHENRRYAALKFFLFTQISGLLMLISILALYFGHHAATGVFSFQYRDLLAASFPARESLPVMLGFFIAFAVKLPAFPFHPWLPDAHTEAPTAGSVILAGLMLKTGAYGFIRFVAPLFPDAARAFAPVAIVLAVIGILYGAILAFAQTDLKRLVAYTSVSHLGFVLLGVFSWNALALQGAVMTMVCHGISTGGLFVLVGALQERIHTREMARMGGLFATIPNFSGAGMVFALASLGLPGLGDFVGEFLVLLGAWRVYPVATALATVGILAATFYALRFIQGAFQGPNTNGWSLRDLSFREAVVAGSMIAALLWLGLYPRPVLDTFAPALDRLQQVRLYSRR
jgi:NADH-quinone oxidoreductase subunit M